MRNKTPPLQQWGLVLGLLSIVPLGACKGATASPIPRSACHASTPLIAGVPGSPGHLVKDSTNPNGTSELALLMREMLANLKVVRSEIEQETSQIALKDDYYRIRCAWPTELSTRNERFDSLGQVMIQTYDQLLEAPLQERKTRYDNVIRSCVACHSQTCRGTLPALKSLYFSKDANLSQDNYSCAEN